MCFPAALPHTVRLVRKLQYQFTGLGKTWPRVELSTYQHRLLVKGCCVKCSSRVLPYRRIVPPCPPRYAPDFRHATGGVLNMKKFIGCVDNFWQ